MNEERLIQLGSCTRAHGIKGGFQFYLFNTEDSVLDEGTEIQLFPQSSQSSLNQSGQSFKINKIQFGNKTIVYLDGVNDRNDVEAIVPFDIFVYRHQLPQQEEGEVYLEDLIGLKVLENNVEIGKIHSYYSNSMQDIIVIRLTAGGSVDLPLVDALVPTIDLEKGLVEVLIPEVIE